MKPVQITAPFAIEHLTAMPDGRVLASGHTQQDRPAFALFLPDQLRWEGPLLLPKRSLDLKRTVVASPTHLLVPGYLPNDQGVIVGIDPFTLTNPASPPVPRALTSVVSLNAQGALISGGALAWDPQSGSQTLTTISELYQGATDSWLGLIPLPGPRVRGEGAWSNQARAILFGGNTPIIADLFSVDVYDPQRATWSRSSPEWAPPNMPEPARWAKRQEIVYQHSGERWRPSHHPPTAAWAQGIALADGHILLSLVATDMQISGALDYVALFDPVRLSWSSPIETPPLSARGLGVALPDGRLITRSALHPCLLTWSQKDGWQNGPLLPPEEQPLAVLQDGRVVVGRWGHREFLLLEVR